jgi:small subunit ribosomal protein S9
MDQKIYLNKEIKSMNKIYYQGIGKRKTSIAQVILTEGSGTILINKKDYSIFFKDLLEEAELIKTPLLLTNTINQLDLSIKVAGGGISSQVEAICLAISKALVNLSKEYRQILKQNLFLSRDSRIKERRKYGLKKARKASQYSKR